MCMWQEDKPNYVWWAQSYYWVQKGLDKLMKNKSTGTIIHNIFGCDLLVVTRKEQQGMGPSTLFLTLFL